MSVLPPSVVISQLTVNGFPDNVGSMEYYPWPDAGYTFLHERLRGLFIPDNEVSGNSK